MWGPSTVIRPVQDEQYGWDDAVVQGGDILAAPSQGRFAYVLRDGETEPPADIKKLWAQKLMIDKILKEIIRPGLTPREIMKSYKQKLADVGIVVIDPQLTRPQTNLFESLCFLKPTLGVWQFSILAGKRAGTRVLTSILETSTPTIPKLFSTCTGWERERVRRSSITA